MVGAEDRIASPNYVADDVLSSLRCARPVLQSAQVLRRVHAVRKARFGFSFQQRTVAYSHPHS